ncbi:MAG: anthranilate synthase component II [Planctomycetaceae bacterium]
MILLLDNHDSFVHNLARYVRRLGQATEVLRSDRIDAAECLAMGPEAIIISPGPKGPEEAGSSVSVVTVLGGNIPILGVCLGHQVIGHAFGANVVPCAGMHGMASEVSHDGQGVFENCRQPMKVGRYHSLAIEESSLPDELVITARACDTGLIMGVRHRNLPIYGVQFHPESVLTEDGADVVANFLRLTKRWHSINPRVKAAS